MKWLRVNKSHPCPVCDRRTWCTFADDGSAAKCMRVRSEKECLSKRNEFCGWLHVLDKSKPRTKYEPEPQAITDFSAAAAKFHEQVRQGDIFMLATDLGVSVAALIEYGLGWATREQLLDLKTNCSGQGCWTFPMRWFRGMNPDPQFRTVGIRLRTPKGFKYAVKGSADGLFISNAHDPNRAIVIVEGPTDACALRTLGFQAVGRPSCRGAEIPTVNLCRGMHVVIIGDWDEPDARGMCAGQEGAKALFERLKPVCKSVLLRWPPKGFNDVRDWVKTGVRRQAVIDWLKNPAAMRATG